jgi:hypothetical protein
MREKLSAWVAQKTEPGKGNDCFYGEVKKNRETFASITADNASQSLMRVWLATGDHRAMLEWWVRGMPIQWPMLYTLGDERATRPSRVSLPTYPFRRDRYWPVQTPASPMLATVRDDFHEFDESLVMNIIDDLIDGDLSVEAAVTRVLN